MGNLPRGATQRAAAGVIPGNDQLDNAAMTEATHRLRDSVRVVAEVLAAASIVWLGHTVTTQTTAIALLAQQVTQMQSSLVSMPEISRELAQVQVEQSEHERRITRLEDGSTKAERWTR